MKAGYKKVLEFLVVTEWEVGTSHFLLCYYYTVSHERKRKQIAFLIASN